MDHMRMSTDGMGRLPLMLGGWAVVATLGEMFRSSGGAFEGDTVAIVRIILAIGGLVAAALFWGGQNGGRDGMLGILVWGALQVPFFASQPDGNYTRQLIDVFAGVSSSTSVNGEYTNYSQVGFNLVGVAIVLGAYQARRRLESTKNLRQTAHPPA